jgi:hypothetical protein
MKWTRKELPGWNEVEYTEPTGRYVIRRRMMSGSRNGTWKAEWAVWDTTKHPVTGRATFSDLATLRDAKGMVE